MPDQAIVKLVREFLRKVEQAGIPVWAGILYGSHARGDARSDSDIDLLVVSANARLKHPASDSELLWGLRRDVDYRIEPILVGMQRWKRDTGSPLLAIARAEGHVVSIDRKP